MTVRSSTEDLIADLQAVVRDAEELLQATSGQAGERVEALRSRARDTLRQARKRLADAEAATLEQARELAESTDNYVRRNPWQAVGMAAGAGLLIGLLISRR